MKRLSLLFFIGFIAVSVFAREVKNVIVMIPDGCSLATISAARWYQWLNNPEKENLCIDPYISGTVRTTCSNAPIGDSAPTTSCYMTGYPSLKGWVSTYPEATANDIVPMDPKRAYQPLMTVLEACKLQGRSTGLVCTCYFTQATPADCSSHTYNRHLSEQIATQQAHNLINVMIGGGAGRLPQEGEDYLKAKGWSVLKNDIEGMRACDNNNMWALFCKHDMAFDIDRDPKAEPSIAEMTREAIKRLSKNDKGFFLMVEGSKVDYAAHSNDAITMITDFLAFDEACGEALKFAKSNKETAVIILSDHGNSGLSIGRRDMANYAGTSAKELFGNLRNFKASSDVIAARVNKTPFNEVQKVFKEMCGFELTDAELDFLNNCSEYRQSTVPKEKRKQVSGSLYSTGLSRTIAQFMTERTGLAFTTNGHTGEDVILASYHPECESRAMGQLTNIDINHYLCSLIGLKEGELDKLTNEHFAPHTTVYSPEQCSMQKVTLSPADNKYQNVEAMQLTVKTQTNRLVFTQSSNIVKVLPLKAKKKETVLREIELPTVVVYVDKNSTFYIPREI